MKSICISTVFSRRRRRWLFLVSFRIVFVVVVVLVVGALQLCRAVGGCKSSETVKVRVLAGVLLSFMNIL